MVREASGVPRSGIVHTGCRPGVGLPSVVGVTTPAAFLAGIGRSRRGGSALDRDGWARADEVLPVREGGGPPRTRAGVPPTTHRVRRGPISAARGKQDPAPFAERVPCVRTLGGSEAMSVNSDVGVSGGAEQSGAARLRSGAAHQQPQAGKP